MSNKNVVDMLIKWLYDNSNIKDYEMELWEILVPTTRNCGKPNRVRFHRVWDKAVRDITGGLTIMPVAKGQWVNPEDGELFVERMIPVRFTVKDKEMLKKVIDVTLKHYDDQIAVMCYRVSEESIITYRK